MSEHSMNRTKYVIAISAGAAITALGIGVLATSHANAESSPSGPVVAAPGGNLAGTPFNSWREAHFAPAQSAQPSSSISEAAAMTDAQSFAQTATTPVAPSTSPTFAKLMTLGAFDAANGNSTDPGLSPDRSVWVVTVDAPTAPNTPPGMPASTASVYTVAIDATTGTLIEKGIGVGYLNS